MSKGWLGSRTLGSGPCVLCVVCVCVCEGGGGREGAANLPQVGGMHSWSGAGTGM